jgi:hypothetical protein
MLKFLSIVTSLLLAVPVSAVTISGSITPTFDSSGLYQPVTFRLSGLVEGDNDGSNVALTVLTSPFAQSLGQYDFLFGGNPGVDPAFIVSSGQISFAFAAFERGTTRFYIGTDNTWLNEIFDSETGDSLYSLSSPTFGVVPEPASWSLLIAGFGLVGAMQRRRRPICA